MKNLNPEFPHSRNGNSKIKMNEEPRPLYWDGIIIMLPAQTDKELKSVKSKDYAIALLINEIQGQLDEYKFHFNYFNNRFYIYQDNYWNEISLDKVELFLRDCAKKYYQNEIKYHTESFYKPLGESFKKEKKVLVESNKSSVLLNCKNLTLEFNQKEFKPREARKEDYLTYRLQYDYNAKAKSPMWDEFLDEMLPNKDHQLLLHQYVGYSFTNNIKLEKALFLCGEGGNGKSVVQEVITELLGKENTSSVSIGKLTKDPNTIMLIEDKLLNYCSENERYFNLAQFRTLVSGEPILGKKLYKDIRSVENYAKLMFNMNSLPNIKEEKESYLRRLLILEFNKKPKKIDPQLHYKIIENELDGIFNRVVEALKILIQNKSFVSIPEIDNLLDEYRYSQDTVQQFIDDCIERSLLNGITKATTIHEYYISYCSRHKEPHLSLISFCKELSRKRYQSIKRNDGNYYDIEVEGGR
jgi:putative DNA primase/helicase